MSSPKKKKKVCFNIWADVPLKPFTEVSVGLQAINRAAGGFQCVWMDEPHCVFWGYSGELSDLYFWKQDHVPKKSDERICFNNSNL